MEKPDLSYHDVSVFVDGAHYQPSKNYALTLECCKAAGWRLWRRWQGEEKLIGGEFDGSGMTIVIAGVVVLGPPPPIDPLGPPTYGWDGEMTTRDT